MKKLINLGCGNRFHKEWINVDFHSSDTNVLAHDLRKGIPYEDETFDMVYHSHIIEHFNREEAHAFIKECYRILKPSGIIRIAFPDLEQIALNYIRLLNELKNNKSEFADDYDWIMLELLDQTVRNSSGGEMAKYFIRKSIPNENFVLQRCGVEAKKLIEWGKHCVENNQIKDVLYKRIIKKLFLRKETICKNIFGDCYRAFQIGRFRLRGEIHQWMYDLYSLGRLLKEVDFKNIVSRDAVTSYLENWISYNLDTEPDGSIYKPDSGYIEAKK